jgi:hypothetical protein
MSQLTRRQIQRPAGTDHIASLIARVHAAPSRRSITSSCRSVFCGKTHKKHDHQSRSSLPLRYECNVHFASTA